MMNNQELEYQISCNDNLIYFLETENKQYQDKVDEYQAESYKIVEELNLTSKHIGNEPNNYTTYVLKIMVLEERLNEINKEVDWLIPNIEENKERIDKVLKTNVKLKEELVKND